MSPSHQDSSTLYWLKVIPLAAIVLISGLLIFLFYQHEMEEFDRFVEMTRSVHLVEQKQLIQEETERVIDLIKFARRNQGEMSELQLQQTLFQEIESIRFGQSGYFFIFDYDGVNLMHPMKYHLVGKNLYQLEDGNGVRVIQELIESAKAGGRYVDYIWDKPDTQQPGEKIGYAMGVEDWQWMVGTGVYIDDIEATLAVEKRASMESLSRSMISVIPIIVFSVAVISLLLFILINRVGQSIIHYQHQIERHNDQLEQEVAQQTAMLVQANQAKDDFLASMSHELRTPLATIIGNSELLAEQITEHELDELVYAIERAGRNQLALVNDILDMSKIDSGKFTIDESPYDLCTLLQDLEKMFRVKAQDQGITFTIDNGCQETHLLMGDGQRIGQILINLIGNAIKFTHQGKVVLDVWNDQRFIHFKVVDSGVGMTPEAMDTLFERFEQADGSISRRFGGSGLGLYISLNLAEMMGGTIDASSKEGVGSIFQLSLPYRPTEIVVQSTREARAEQSVLQHQFSGSVLVAEDTPELQLLERRILESMGVTVAVANNGIEAVEQASQQSFDLILMDMQMPEMDGISATRALHQAGITTPVVPLTANVMQKHRDAFEAEGCSEFLGKPIDKQELARVLQKYLTPPVVAEAMPEEMDEEMMAIFKESMGTRHQGLQQALAQRDRDQLRALAHQIKGSAGSFGYFALATVAADVQHQLDEDGVIDDEKVTRLIQQVGALLG